MRERFNFAISPTAYECDCGCVGTPRIPPFPPPNEPFTPRLLERAGIEPGMRVLDVGCGPGDVSFLVHELVGGEGSVVGVERMSMLSRPRATGLLDLG